MTALTEVRNIGPKMAAQLRAVGIDTAEDLRALGADAAYLKMLAAGERPHFIAYYVLCLGLQGRPWNDLGAEEKATLRRRFDALKAQAGPKNAARSELEEALNRLGVVPEDKLR
ncbi:MAG: TfoX/Sxy family DNA transformation protein [Pseudomonadota bacterium]